MLSHPTPRSRPSLLLQALLVSFDNSTPDHFLAHLGRLFWRLPRTAANDPVQPAFKSPSRRGGADGDWTDGLNKRTANALRAFGLTGRDQVAALSSRRLKHIPNIGASSLRHLRRWLAATEPGHSGSS